MVRGLKVSQNLHSSLNTMDTGAFLFGTGPIKRAASIVNICSFYIYIYSFYIKRSASTFPPQKTSMFKVSLQYFEVPLHFTLGGKAFIMLAQYFCAFSSSWLMPAGEKMGYTIEMVTIRL
uniref:Uncharacterized protein n=1 Tax=Arundo donax TaxID=35708 RepID=A0A0A9E6N4_ARUDO